MVFKVREVIGADKDINAITRNDARRVRDLFIGLPPNATKRFPKLYLTEAARVADREGLKRLNVRTVNSHVTKMATMFN